MKRDAKIAAVFVERVFLFGVAFGDHRGDAGGGGEQRGGLGTNDLEVAALAGLYFALRGELIDLALGDHRAGV